MTAAKSDIPTDVFVTRGGVEVERSRTATRYEGAIDDYIERLDSRRGAVFSSNYEYPGRYTRWDTAIIDPPLSIIGHGRAMRLEAHNERGEAVLSIIARRLERGNRTSYSGSVTRKALP